MPRPQYAKIDGKWVCIVHAKTGVNRSNANKMKGAHANIQRKAAEKKRRKKAESARRMESEQAAARIAEPRPNLMRDGGSDE